MSIESPATDFQAGAHGCFVYSDLAEAIGVCTAYFEQGLLRGERCIFAHDDDGLEALRVSLHAAGVDVAAAEKRGLLRLLRAADVYLPGGVFDGTAMVAMWAALAEEYRADGCAGLRVAGSAPSFDGDREVIAAFLDYEALVDPVLHEYGVTALCLYDRRLFDDEVLCGAVRNHAVVRVGGQTCCNALHAPGVGSQFTPSPTLDGLFDDIAHVETILARHGVTSHAALTTQPGGARQPADLSFLVTCCACGDIRAPEGPDRMDADSPGNWLRTWRFLTKYVGATISHGYCPTCYQAAVEVLQAEPPR